VANDEAPPKGVAPHEGCELELMLAGEKPLAMFGDAVDSDCRIPEADFAPYVADGTIVRREEVYRPRGTGVAGRFVYFARAEEEWRIEAMHRINGKLFVHGECTSSAVEREIGRLLGYADSDIERYLEWIDAKRAGRT
jgi:hypothetical protein